MTRCLKCASDNPETQLYCGGCGTRLPVDLRRPVRVPDGDETIPLPAIELSPDALFARRYELIEEIGAGGMGRVYRVRDIRLDEEIVLKVIRPEIASKRVVIEHFASELKLARQVVHRNVARMFDLNEEGGIPYITMEYVHGEDLKRLIRKVGRLDPAQAVPIALQVCDGLAEAHRLGIAHHDLKPQNIMIDEEGRAKIMDFGLARLVDSGDEDDAGPRTGSPAYASPERIRGDAADGRADLYSLGIVLYEMLTGRTPFRADSTTAVLDMHLHKIPDDPREIEPSIPAALSRTVLKCLEKDPGARFQSAAELRQALGSVRAGDAGGAKAVRLRKAAWIGGAAGLLAVAAAAFVLVFNSPGPLRRSVAVLPVEDAGFEQADPLLLAALQREVTDQLAAIPSLRVLPTYSVNSYDLKGLSAPQIGEALGVRDLVQISLAIEEGRVSARIYLFEADRNLSPSPLTYDAELKSPAVLRDELAELAATALGVDLDPESQKKFSRRGTHNIEAYGLFLEGMQLLEKGGHEAVGKAIAAFERAIDLDPAYALGHWGLGYAYENLYYLRSQDKDPEALAEMYEHLNKASQIDPTFAETNLGLGWYFFNKEDNRKAFESFRKALELDPDGYFVNRDTGAFLRSLGLYRQAMVYLTRAAKLSPRDPLPLVQIAQCWMFLGRCEKALTYSTRALALLPGDADANIMHIILLALTGRMDDAGRQVKAMERFDLDNPRLPFLREMVTALRQGRGKPYRFTSAGPSLSPHGTYLYLSFGMTEEALANIRRGIDAGFWNGMYLYSYPSLVRNPWYKAFRRDARFEEILRRQKALYDSELKPLEDL